MPIMVDVMMRAVNRHRLRLILSISLSVILLVTTAPPVPAAPDKPTLLGFATGPDWRQDLPAFTREAGRPAAIYQLFWGVETDWSAGWVANILSELEALGFTPVHRGDNAEPWALNSGVQDAKLREMGVRSQVG